MAEEHIRVEDRILREFRNIAVVGLSTSPERPSYRIASYLAGQGYNIIPVNPNAPEIMGRKSYPDLSSIPEEVDVVQVFRRAEDSGKQYAPCEGHYLLSHQKPEDQAYRCRYSILSKKSLHSSPCSGIPGHGPGTKSTPAAPPQTVRGSAYSIAEV